MSDTLPPTEATQGSDVITEQEWLSWPIEQGLLIQALIRAAISMDDHDGLGSDEVRRIAREIKQMQEGKDD
jgi:hypothetical protein